MLRCLVGLFLVLHCSLAQLQEGEPCQQEDGTHGVCRFVTDCPSATNKIATELCSVDNHAPIVCCLPIPFQNGVRGTSSRKSTNHKADNVIIRDTSSRKSTNHKIDSVAPTVQRAKRRAGRDHNSIAVRKCREYGRYVFWQRELSVLSVIPQYVNVSDCAQTGETLIVGGTEAAPKEFPHMVAIGYGPNTSISWSCGGSLISERFVLTAAHCTAAYGLGRAKWVRLGDLNLKSTVDDKEAKTVEIMAHIRHPNYRTRSHYDDIALFKLKSDVTFTPSIRPACLHTTTISPHNATATGWGKLISNAPENSDTLMKVTLKLDYNNVRCNQVYQATEKLASGIKGQSMICAGDPKEEKDTCGGDSGGPLQINLRDPYCMYSIIGVTSFGPEACGLGDNPAVYTRVSHYIPWIEGIVWPQN